MPTEKDYQRWFLRETTTLDEYTELVSKAPDDKIMTPKERMRSWDEFKKEGLLSADWNNPRQVPQDHFSCKQWLGIVCMLIGMAIVILGVLGHEKHPITLILGLTLMTMPSFVDYSELAPEPKPTNVASPIKVDGMPTPIPPVIDTMGRPLKAYKDAESLWVMSLSQPPPVDAHRIEQLHKEVEERLAMTEWALEHATPRFLVPSESTGEIHKWK